MLKLDVKLFKKQIESSELVKNLKRLSGKKVEVGYFTGTMHPVNPSSIMYAHLFGLFDPKPIDMAKLARCMNYGTISERPIPARPFFDNAYRQIATSFRKNATKNVMDVNFYENFSDLSKKEIYKSIDEGSYTQLADITIKLKGHDKPLIGDSGLLIASVKSEIK